MSHSHVAFTPLSFPLQTYGRYLEEKNILAGKIKTN